MEEIKIKGDIVPIKFDENPKTPEINESNIGDSIKALGEEFSTNKVSKITTISESKKS